MAILDAGPTPTDADEFVIGANRHYLAVLGQVADYRKGQAYWNYFSHHFPDEAMALTATCVDCFYHDENVVNLIEHIIFTDLCP